MSPDLAWKLFSKSISLEEALNKEEILGTVCHATSFAQPYRHQVYIGC
jgi:hypothetical protein